MLGTGLSPLGIRRAPPDLVEFTVWLTLFWIPIIPVRSWRAKFFGEYTILGVTDSGEHFIDAARVPHKLNDIVATFLRGWLLFAIGIAPATYLILQIQGRAATNSEFVLVVASAIWPVALAIVAQRKQLALLRASSDLYPNRRTPPGRVKEIIGTLAFTIMIGWPAMTFDRLLADDRLLPYVFLIATLVGAICGYLVLPSCPRAGAVAGALAGPCAFLALFVYCLWRPDARPEEGCLVQVVACLPAIGLGYFLRHRWLIRSQFAGSTFAQD